uniref:Uncharacterized protein n=1 Tax=Salix viminalis TaxID=40686 RepID=A0A6N2KQA4_SALVM
MRKLKRRTRLTRNSLPLDHGRESRENMWRQK